MTRPGLVLRLLALTLAVSLLLPLQAVAVWGGSRLAGRVPLVVHRLFLRLFGIRVAVLGTPPRPGVPVLVLANHVSWLDIPIMAASAPLSFIAKQEIAGWPVVGILSRLQRCVFLDRSRKSATAKVNTVVGHRLARGEAIVLFPEGTTGDGIRLLPFRSSLVGAARAALAEPDLATIRLQPLAIAYLRRNGLPIGRREMPEVAWFGDMDLAPHASGFVKGGPLDVAVIWGDPIRFDASTDRKRATLAAEAAVRVALRTAKACPSEALFSCRGESRKRRSWNLSERRRRLA